MKDWEEILAEELLNLLYEKFEVDNFQKERKSVKTAVWECD